MGKLRILVAEFDSATVMDLRKRLERAGYELAGLVRSALELPGRIRDMRPDAVLLNPAVFRSPTQSWTYAEMQEQIGVPVVFLGRPDPRSGTSESGGEHPFSFLRSPFDDTELTLAVRSVLALQRLRDAAREATGRVEALSALLNDCAFMCAVRSDGSLEPEWVSESFERITGYGQGDVIGVAAWKALVHRDDLPKVERYLGILVEGRAEALEFRIIRADGAARWMHVACRPVPDGRGSGVARLYGVATDISETRILRDTLREGEERWRFAIDASGEAVWDWNVHTNEVFSSDRWKEMVGMRDDEVASDFSDWDRRIHPDDQKRVHSEIRRYFRGETPQFEAEYRVQAANGTVMWVLDRGKIVGWTQDGKPARVIGTRKDITRRKQIEEALEMSNTFLRDILESSSAISIVSTDPDGNILFWNSGAENLLGFKAEEMVGQRNIGDLYDPEDQETQRGVTEMRERVLKQKRPISRTLQEIHKDGRRLWVKVTVAPRLDAQGNVKGLIGIGEDVTAQREALKASEQRGREMRLLAFTLNCARDGFCITDLEGTILYANASLLTMCGYADGDLVGQHIAVLHSPSASPQTLREMEIGTRHGGWLGELQHRRKDGTEFPAEVSTSIVRNDDGEEVALVAVVRDIAERRKAEDHIRSSLHEKEILLKEIHHRVKNNLQVITSLLNLQSTQGTNPETAAILRESQARIRSMALVHEELYQSRDLAKIDMANYVRKLTASLFRVYRSPDAEVGLQIDVRDVFLSVDAAIPCGLIINELVSNSLKYAFRTTRKGSVSVRMTHAGGEYELRVGDDGEGLPVTLNVEKTDSLGLQLVHTLVKQLRAVVRVSREGGTIFTVVIPGTEARGDG